MQLEHLPKLDGPESLRGMSDQALVSLADEIRRVLCYLVSQRSAHFASNLGVVELAIALHKTFDFRQDRLIWDTGHQIYPHKLLTGRFNDFSSIRQRGGLMGYPNPVESPYDLFLTGHASSSVSTVLGMKVADDLQGENRRSVAVIGDGALPSGIVFEAFNNIQGRDLLVILNDNKMGICPRVGGLAQYLDRARTTPLYEGFKTELKALLKNLPLVGKRMHDVVSKTKDALKHYLNDTGTLFEEFGFRYLGPIDGHNLKQLQSYLEMVKKLKGPVLLHVFTEKGHGFQPACEDPVLFHTPPPIEVTDSAVKVKKSSSRSYTDPMSEAIYRAMERDPKVAVLTAAMCEGNKLSRVRNDFPNRFFDTGICEGHAVAFAGGMAKSGMRPIVDIYSTFLQRSFDQIFQEVALQNLPVTFCLDRAGLCGPDGPTHHGSFDLAYMRIFPNMVVMAPGDELEIGPMLDFALTHTSPTSIRYPKTSVERIEREVSPIELGKSEVLRAGTDGVLIAIGTTLGDCLRAADRLKTEGIDVGVINARFLKPLDTETLLEAVAESVFVVTVEEGCLVGGFGAAVLEACNSAGVRTNHIRRIGIPDRFVEHGERSELLHELGLDVDGIVETARSAFESHAQQPQFI